MPAYLVAGHSSQALHLTFAYVRIYIHAYIAFYSVGWCIHYHLYCTYLALFILLTVCKADDLFILHQQAVQRFWAENIPWSRLRKAYVHIDEVDYSKWPTVEGCGTLCAEVMQLRPSLIPGHSHEFASTCFTYKAWRCQCPNQSKLLPKIVLFIAHN